MVLVVGGSDVVEEDGLCGRFRGSPGRFLRENSHLNDATSTPHTSNTGVIQVPVELRGVNDGNGGTENDNPHP